MRKEDLKQLGFIEFWHINAYQYELRINENINIEWNNSGCFLYCENENADLNIDLATFMTMVYLPSVKTIDDMKSLIKLLS